MIHLLVTILCFNRIPKRFILRNKLKLWTSNWLVIIWTAKNNLHKNDCLRIVSLFALSSRKSSLKLPNVLAVKSHSHLLKNNHWRVRLHKTIPKLVHYKKVRPVALVTILKKNHLEMFAMTRIRVMMILLKWIQFLWLKSKHLPFKQIIVHHQMDSHSQILSKLSLTSKEFNSLKDLEFFLMR